MIYLDCAATSKPRKEIIDEYYELSQKVFANPSSIHQAGLTSFLELNKARMNILKVFRLPQSEVIFTSGATEANNLAIKGVSLAYQNRGKHIIVGINEHPSVLNAVKQLHELFGFEVSYAPSLNDGRIDLNALISLIRDDTILVSIMAVNNETGAINDLTKIRNIIEKHPKIIFHSDCTQAIGKVDLDLKAVDLFSFSAHKINGLKGSGALIKKKNVRLVPLLSGGGQENNFRSGTEDLISDVLLAKTVQLAMQEKDQNLEIIKQYADYIYHELSKNAEYIMNTDERVSSPYIINFSLKSRKASVVVEGLSNEGIMVSSLSACSSKKEPLSYVLLSMSKGNEIASNSIRVSIDKDNTILELQTFISILNRLTKELHKR